MDLPNVMTYIQSLHDQSIQKDFEIARLKTEAEQRDESRITVEEELRKNLDEIEKLNGKVRDLEAKSEKKDQKIGELLMRNEELEERIKELEGAEHMETEQPVFRYTEQPDMEFHTRVIKSEPVEELEPEKPQVIPVNMRVLKAEQPDEIITEQPPLVPVVDAEQPVQQPEQPMRDLVVVNTEQPVERMEPEQPEDEDPAERSNRRIMEILNAVRHEQPEQPAGQKKKRNSTIRRVVKAKKAQFQSQTLPKTSKTPRSLMRRKEDSSSSTRN